MKKSIAAVFFILVLMTFGGRAFAETQQEIEDTALKVAESWLEVVDQGHYSESWDLLAGLFQEKVSRDSWKEELTTLRGSVGRLSSRSLIGARYVRNLPDAPAGEYVVVQYQSVYTLHAFVLETVVSMLGPDTEWRVAGYYIQGDVAVPATPD